jgi:hypothetical protein
LPTRLGKLLFDGRRHLGASGSDGAGSFGAVPPFETFATAKAPVVPVMDIAPPHAGRRAMSLAEGGMM